MKNLKFTSLARYILLVAMSIWSVSASASLYITGGFDGWRPKEPVEFTRTADGLYTVTIDFTNSTSFKMSTVKGVSDNGWSEFDSGTIAFEGTPAVGVWCPVSGIPKSPNQHAPQAAVLTLTVDLDNMRACFGDLPVSDAPWSGTLPVLFINTDGGVAITSKEEYVSATYYLDPMGVEGVKAIGSADTPLTTQIRGRGNFTWTGFEKKPYRLKLTDKQAMLGMPKSKHWALLAHADDNRGFLRNFTGLTVSRMLGMPWTPGSKPVEVVLNGDYIGLYFLTETVRVAKERVDVVEQEDLATADVDGGWLVEIDNYDTDPHVTVYENLSTSHPIWFTYKSPEVLSSEQHDYLLDQMRDIDRAIYNPDKKDASVLEALVDLDVLARYYITQEIVDDTESFHGSCYLNRQRGNSERWKFGPVWDFGNAFMRGDSEKFIYQDPTWHQVWIGEICKFDAFQDAVRRVWTTFVDNGPAELDASINEFVNDISIAAACDARRWPKYGNPDEQARGAWVRSWLSRRISWLKTQWGDSGVDCIDIPSAHVRVTTSAGTITLTSETPQKVAIYTAQGIVARTVRVSPDASVTVEGLPSGLYIVAGKKVII